MVCWSLYTAVNADFPVQAVAGVLKENNHLSTELKSLQKQCSLHQEVAKASSDGGLNQVSFPDSHTYDSWVSKLGWTLIPREQMSGWTE